MNHDETLPPEIRDWLGLIDVIGGYDLPDDELENYEGESPPYHFADSLTDLNDTQQMSFEEIANFIEEKEHLLIAKPQPVQKRDDL